MANLNKKPPRGGATAKPETVPVTYTDVAGVSHTLDAQRGVERVDVDGGWLIPEWDETEELLGSTFEPTPPKAEAVTPTEPHADASSLLLRTRLDQIVAQMDAADALQGELDSIKYALALRIQREKVSAIKTATGTWFAKKPSGKGKPPFPMTLGRERPRVIGALTD